jgi:hypothetical protein
MQFKVLNIHIAGEKIHKYNFEKYHITENMSLEEMKNQIEKYILLK